VARSLSGSNAARGTPRFTGTTAWARSLPTPLRSFLRTETGGAAGMLAAAVAALVWANVDVGSYEDFWTTTLSIDAGGATLSLDYRHWVNSGLMTLFFFVVGLEARREFDLGELRERRRFALPLVAALGGIAASVTVYVLANWGASSVEGSRPTPPSRSACSRS
jgi:Na+/H+ antiporter NhaA